MLKLNYQLWCLKGDFFSNPAQILKTPILHLFMNYWNNEFHELGVVYFDQRLGAAHPNYKLKYAFLMFITVKS